MTIHAQGHMHDRRRTIRIRRSALLQSQLDDIDRPSIKIAETRDELEQAFSLVYYEYQNMGYITEPLKYALAFIMFYLKPRFSSSNLTSRSSPR